ncbi:MAG: hypothetical protein MJ238_06435, partial [Bacilli bacterium]|nr:hypothetical protein [Bacilli bacterium]
EREPRRIIRWRRCASSRDFEIEEEPLEAIEDNKYLLEELNPEKIKEEKRKGWEGTYDENKCDQLN